MGPLEKNTKPLPLKFISCESPLFVSYDYLYYSRHLLVNHN